MSARPALGALAGRLGILPGYRDYRGRPVATTDRQRLAVLATMGVDAATEARARRALAALDDAAAARPLAPARVLAGRGARAAWTPLPPGTGAWRLEVHEEAGRVHRREGARRGGGRAPLPAALPLGYHRLVLAAGGRRHEQRLIVTPGRCPTPARRLFGLTVNLYTLRSQRDWGIGDLGDLRSLVGWCGALGAAFVGVNPLHALRNAGVAISPYSPVSRLYRNVLYLDPTAIPEFRSAPAVRRLAESAAFGATLAALRATAHVDYEGVRAARLPLYRILYRAFRARRDGPRARAYAAYRAAEGDALVDFATFVALEEHLGSAGWRRWPARFRDPRGPAVARFRAAHPDAVGFQCWLQFELDCQLAGVAAAARRAGLPIGVYQDLAIGSAPDGSDRWSFPGLFVDGAHVGAPPDDYAAEGQDWGLPPLDPRRLAADGYGYWIRLVRGALAHAGALRIDHVMGLFRQFWIPAGGSGVDGAYVASPADALLGILALEATRAGALVVGEDLGTVPPGLPRVLARWGILGSRVLVFERTRAGAFRSAARYPRRVLVTANTHDMAPLAGYWSGRDLEIRRRVGLLADDAALARARSARAAERRALVRRLRAAGVLGRGPAPAGAALRGAVHAFLCRTPAALVGVALDDLAGETEPVNVPGVGPDRYPSWSRRMRTSLERLARDPDARTALAGTRGRAFRRRQDEAR